MESAFRSAIDGLTAYASGLSRPADFMAAAQAGHAVGVVAEELSASAMALLAQAVVDFRIPLFVDSGAYGHFRRDGPMSSAAIDFAVVLQAYDDVLEAICAENAAEEHLPPPLLVMPDVPGDQAASARQLWAHRGYVSSLLRFPRLARPIIPLHHGRRPLSWLYRDLVQMLGSEGFIVGIPAAAAALPASSISELFTNAAPRAVHVLGALSERRLHPRIWQVLAVAASPPDFSADANVVRGRVIRGAMTASQRRAGIVRELGRAARRQELEGYLAECGDLKGLRLRFQASELTDRRRILRFLAEATETTPDRAAADFVLTAPAVPRAA